MAERLRNLRREAPGSADRRRAAEEALLDAVLLPSEPPVDSVGASGQALLMKSLARLERQPGVAAAVAWSRDGEGRPRVLGALPASYAGRIEPTPALFDAITERQALGILRTRDGELPEPLTGLAAQGLAAAASVAGLGAGPAAILMLFVDPPGRPLRPRVEAVLDEVARALGHSLATHLAIDRLSQLDRAVQRLDRLAALGSLVAEIVHEVRNPLVSVKTFLQLLPERLEDPDFHRDFREVVAGEVVRLERMLDDLLHHARPRALAEPGAGGRIDEAIGTTLKLLGYRSRERGVEFETKIASALPAVALADDALRQVLLNLVLNATEVTPEGGRIRVVADWCSRRVNQIELLVEDQGPGIDPGRRERLFEPFWTTRAEGAGGLGLAICKRLVEEAGGSVDVHNAREGGACFRLSLPIEG